MVRTRDPSMAPEQQRLHRLARDLQVRAQCPICNTRGRIREWIDHGGPRPIRHFVYDRGFVCRIVSYCVEFRCRPLPVPEGTRVCSHISLRSALSREIYMVMCRKLSKPICDMISEYLFAKECFDDALNTSSFVHIIGRFELP